jgi:Rab9 effector protein with kelch motifs
LKIVNGEYDWFKFPYDCNNFTSVEYEGVLFFFGGFNNQEKSTTNQLVEFNLTKRSYLIININGRLPPTRMFHTSVVYKSKMYIFGGKTTSKSGLSKELNDLWTFDLKKKKWQKIEAKGKIPESIRGNQSFFIQKLKTKIKIQIYRYFITENEN